MTVKNPLLRPFPTCPLSHADERGDPIGPLPGVLPERSTASPQRGPAGYDPGPVADLGVSQHHMHP